MSSLRKRTNSPSATSSQSDNSAVHSQRYVARTLNASLCVRYNTVTRKLAKSPLTHFLPASASKNEYMA